MAPGPPCGSYRAASMGILAASQLHGALAAFHPATRHYVSLEDWEEHIPVNSTMHVAEGLLSGAYDSGITFLDIAEKHSTKLRVEIKIGTVDDPWIVYGKQDVF